MVGGQPLLIVGVAEPIVLIYSFMYQFAKGEPRPSPNPDDNLADAQNTMDHRARLSFQDAEAWSPYFLGTAWII